MEYKTRAWQTVGVDLGPSEARDVDMVAPAIAGVAEMGLPVTPQVRCISIHEQAAAKRDFRRACDARLLCRRSASEAGAPSW